MKVCIFYTAAVGSGHKRCAQIIEKEFDNVVLVDALKESNWVLDYLVSHGYSFMLRYIPKFYKKIYVNEKRLLNRFKSAKKLFFYLCSIRFNKIIEREKPDVVICTQAFPCGVLSMFKGNYKLVSVITDFHLNSSWTSKNVDAYAVSCYEVRDELIHEGIDPAKIKVTGIPTNSYKKTKGELVLIMGGGAGLGDLEKVANLVSKRFKTKVLVGNNKELFKRLKDKFDVSGYVNNIEEYYAQSFVAITKPGGLTCSELINMQIPIIMLDPLPGQEEKNADFLIRNKVAIKLDKIEDLVSIIENLDKKIDYEKIKVFAKPNAREEVKSLVSSVAKTFEK